MGPPQKPGRALKVVFHYADKSREEPLAKAFIEGVIEHGDEGLMVPKNAGDFDCDFACMVGVKSVKLFRRYLERGIGVLYFDKGYLRGEHRESPGYWRVSINSHHPTDYLVKASHEPNRGLAMGLKFDPWRSGRKILIAGSSLKYHDFYRLPDPTSYAKRVVREIRRYSGRPIVYRPKPSWHDAVKIGGTAYSEHTETIHQALEGAHVLVTHGSNACFEAVTLGVPVISLGNCVATPISSTSLKEIESPRLASDDERRQWLSNLAYCQYTLQEMRNGFAWAVIKGMASG